MCVTRLVLGAILALCIAVPVAAQEPDLATSRDVQIAFERLVAADNRGDALKARVELAEYGELAFATVITGTEHEKKTVRESCYRILCDGFPSAPKAIDAIIRGLQDREQSIRYRCAFHLGDHRIGAAKIPLKACIDEESNRALTKYGAAKSLAELGDDSVTTMLYVGLGSDDHYTRYLSNIGIKALAGKDLSDFGYGGPWEGAFVSGPAVYRAKGDPIGKAKKRFERWRAIVAFLEWLKSDRPHLFRKLEDSWL